MRGKDRKREIFHLLVHFPDGYSGQRWAWLKPGARNFIQVSHMGARAQDLCCIPLLSQVCQQEAGSKVKQLGFKPAHIWDAEIEDDGLFNIQ